MNQYTIMTAVETYLSTNWTATPIRIVGRDDAPALPFIECHYKPALTTAIEINGHVHRKGVFMINTYTRLNVGLYEGWTYAGLLETLFFNKILSNHIVCENDFISPYSTHIGIDTELQAQHFQTVIPFSVISED
jgi:hypothetical protein